ncbi:MAG: hypothetical protein WBL93_01760 [Lutisporaceae bacterium]
MKLFIVKRALVLIVGIVILALFIASVYYAFNPIAETFKNSIEYQKAERQFLKKYTALQDKFEFMLPSTWSTMEQTFSGGEIIYSLAFMSDDKKTHGIVQVWDIDKPLKQFIDESKESAVGVVDFKYYRVKEIKSNQNKGYLLDYSRRTDQDKYVRAYEAFIEGANNRIYRVSFFVNEENWKSQYIILFNRIIRALTIKQ